MTARNAAGLRQRPRHVVMLAYPDVQMLDVTGPLEVFSRAARWMQDLRATACSAQKMLGLRTARGHKPPFGHADGISG